jgi:hypothetical protein
MKRILEPSGANTNPPPTYAKPPAPPAPPDHAVRVGDIVDVYFSGECLHRGCLVVKVMGGHVECVPLPTIDPEMIPVKEKA